MLVTRRRRCRSPRRRHGARRRAAAIPDADREGLDDPARSRQYSGPAARIRPHGADRLRPVGAAAVRHDRRHSRMPARSTRSARSISAANARSPAGATSTGIPRWARCRPARRRSASSSATCPTRWSARPSSTRHTAAIPISTRCRCTASCSPSRIRSTPRTCARPAAATRATTSISRRATMCWSSNCATRAPSSSPRPSTPNTTAAPAIPAAATSPDKVLPSTLGYQRSTWAGNPSNPYDTTRSASLGSSSGSALSVSANLVMASLGEETRASCRGPSNHNAVALILPHKSMLGFDGGAIGADIYCDRTRHSLRAPSSDCAKVLDALKDPVEGYYDPRDPFTTVPRSSVLSTPYASHAKAPGTPGALQGHAPRRHPRIDDPSRPARRPRSRSSAPRPRKSKPCSASISACNAGRIRRPALARRDPDDRADDSRLPRRRWRGWCRCSCRTCCSA